MELIWQSGILAKKYLLTKRVTLVLCTIQAALLRKIGNVEEGWKGWGIKGERDN